MTGSAVTTTLIYQFLFFTIAQSAWGNFYSIAQDNPHHRYPKVSAHRGASGVAPENTLAAFAKAIELGAHFIEIDVRTTFDGKQICIHDASLKRTTGFNDQVRNLTFQKIKDLSAGEVFGHQFVNEKIPSLEEVCHLVAGAKRSGSGDVNLYVDCKEINAGEVIRLLTRFSLLDSAVFYGEVKTLEEIRQIAPAARLMPSYPGADGIDGIIAALDPFAFDVPWTETDSTLVTDCHSRGIKVFVDLLDEYDNNLQYLRAIRLGIDLIQTDDVPGVKRSISEYEKNLRNEK